MVGFQYGSSSPVGSPSTPDGKKSRNIFATGLPSATNSFTPTGPPPSSHFGSSTASNPVKPLSFSQHSNYEHLASPQFPSSPDFMRSNVGPYQSAQHRRDLANLSEEDEDYMDDHRRYNDSQDFSGDDISGEDGDYDQSDAMDEDEFRSPQAERNGSNLLLTAPVGFRQSGENEDHGASFRESDYGKIARDLSRNYRSAPVEEPHCVILQTEAAVNKLYDEGIGPAEDNDMLRRALATIPDELLTIWADYERSAAVPHTQIRKATIGPGNNASNFAKANFLAQLALQIHHPKLKETRTFTPEFKPLPQIMLEWMSDYHDPLFSQIDAIQTCRPGPASHLMFWPTVHHCLIRGKVLAATQLLEHAGWRHAFSGADDVDDGSLGYVGAALENVEKVIFAATQVLDQCPAVHGDWDVHGGDWTMFRTRLSQAEEDLKNFAEGKDRASRDFARSSIGTQGRYSRIAEKAESLVPWHIYQNLLVLYKIVSGDASAIAANSQDWCEATVGLLVWMDEGKDSRRLQSGRSISAYRSSFPHYDSESYLKKLRRSFHSAMGSGIGKVNTADLVEVGLACVFEEESEGLMCLLRSWSGPISSAVAEVASLAGWLPRAEPQSLISMGSLDEMDMQTLGRGASSPSKDDGVKDQALIAYSTQVAKKGSMRCQLETGEIIREGWQIAISVLGRLDSTERSEEKIGEFISQMDLTSEDRVDKLWRLLNDLGLTPLAEDVAETYADMLAEESHKYGQALWYYSLAHKPSKVKDVLGLLTSYSLMYSTAYPPEAELDEHLKQLVLSPKDALNALSLMDADAAQTLNRLLSGYATLRRFFNLRDADVLDIGESKRLGQGPIQRRQEAAIALLAAIASADDNVRGGLYDEDRGAVVNVDFLLALLGEAMVFVNQPDFTLSASQISGLLRAIEDIQAVGPRIQSATNEFLKVVLDSAQGMSGSTPMSLLRQSTSGMSGTSGSFEMVQSSMFASQFQKSIRNSGMLVKASTKRGWDWRKGVTADTTAEDVLRILRLGLAKDLAKAWLVDI